MQQGSKIPSTSHNGSDKPSGIVIDPGPPQIIIEGLDSVIKLDLGKHQQLLAQAKLSAQAFREAVSHQVKRKKYYRSLIGGGKFDDKALKVSLGMIQIDIRAMSDKVKLALEEISHHTLIVDTLTEQLENYYKDNAIRN